jgi:hypothetical protein
MEAEALILLLKMLRGKLQGNDLLWNWRCSFVVNYTIIFFFKILFKVWDIVW